MTKACHMFPSLPTQASIKPLPMVPYAIPLQISDTLNISTILFNLVNSKGELSGIQATLIKNTDFSAAVDVIYNNVVREGYLNWGDVSYDSYISIGTDPKNLNKIYLHEFPTPVFSDSDVEFRYMTPKETRTFLTGVALNQYEIGPEAPLLRRCRQEISKSTKKKKRKASSEL